MITTERLRIRRIRTDDIRAVKRLWLDASASPYAQYDRPYDTSDRAVTDCVKRWAAVDGWDDMFLAVCLDSLLIGYIVLYRHGDAREIGYCFHSDYHGHGYARESLAALFAYLKEHGITRLTAGTALDNTPSVKLLYALGFALKERGQVSFYQDENGDDLFFDAGEFELLL